MDSYDLVDALCTLADEMPEHREVLTQAANDLMRARTREFLIREALDEMTKAVGTPHLATD